MPLATFTDMMASAAKRKREDDDELANIRRLRQRAEEEEALARRPKYVFFDGVHCVRQDCRSNMTDPPPAEFKPYFYPSHGFMVCDQCGTVQPGSQVMIRDEERRTFADDRERGIDHARTERVREGESGGCSVPSSLQRASRIAESNASGEVKDRERRYINCIRELAAVIESFKDSMRDIAMMYAHNLAHAVENHRECCKDKECRLRKKMPRDGYLIAAALICKAAEKFEINIRFKDLSETYLKRVGREHYSPGTVSRTYDVVRALINGYEDDGKYNCMLTANVQAPAAAPDHALLKYTQTVQRVCEALELPYPTQLRAKEIVTDWFNQGLGGNTHEVVAGAAVWSVVKDEGGHHHQIEAVADAAGCAADTIKKALAKHI